MAALEDKMLQFFELCINNTEGALPDAAMAFYTAAINAVASQTNVSNIQFDTTPLSTEDVAGNMFWDEQDDAVAYVTGLGNTVQIGQEVFGVGINKTGETALAGRVVYANGVEGIRPTYDYADARDATKCSWVGVVSADTDNNQQGPVTTFGILHDMDTSEWEPGTKLYVHTTDSGILTSTPPVTPNYCIWVGTVLVQHNNQGTMFVDPRIDHSNGVRLHSLDILTDFTAGQKIKLTQEGGYAVRMNNKTGAPSIKGSLVSVSTGTDNAVQLQSNEYDTIGIVYEDGIADGSDMWIVVSGRAQVLMKDTVATTRGGIFIAADTDGRANWIANPGSGLPAADIHFKEIGHCMETKDAGTNVLVYGMIHFN